MNARDHDRVGSMLNPPHLGELIRESKDEVGCNVTETADAPRLRTRNTLAPAQRQEGVYPPTWHWRSKTSAREPPVHWMRMQASYEHAQARLRAGDHRSGESPRGMPDVLLWPRERERAGRPGRVPDLTGVAPSGMAHGGAFSRSAWNRPPPI